MTSNIPVGFRLKQYTDEELEELWNRVKNGPAINKDNFEGFKKSYSPLEDLVFEHAYGIVRFARIHRGCWMEFHGFALSHHVFGILEDIQELIRAIAQRYSIKVVFSAIPRRGDRSVGKFLKKLGFQQFGYDKQTDRVEYYKLVNGGFYG